MRRSIVVSLLVGVTLLIAGTAFALLQTTQGGAISISADKGCRAGSSVGQQGEPRGEPVRMLEISIGEGDRFELPLLAGEWVARLHANGPTFTAERWATGDPLTDLTRGWCHGEDTEERYVTHGEGSIVIRYWTGEKGGLVIK